MKILYKTIFSAVFILLFGMSTMVHADNDLYTVENIIVDKTAENAVVARDAAIMHGQQMAFEILTRRLLMDDEDEQAQQINDLQLSSMINDFETGQEKFSSKRYRAVMTVRFNPSAVKNYLNQMGRRGIVEAKGKPVLILPYISEKDATYMWSRDNPWLKEWQNTSSRAGLVPIIAPTGDIQDAAEADENQILMSGQNEISLLLNRYKADKVLVPVAERTEAGADITIYEYIGSELSPVKNLTVENENEALLWSDSVRAVRNYINKDWKNHLKYSAEAVDDRTIDVNVEFSTMRDWLQMQKMLLSMPEIANIQTKTFNRNKAQVQVSLNASPADLTNALVSRNMILTKVQDSTGYGSAAQPAVYKLSENVSTYSYPSYETLPVPDIAPDMPVVQTPETQIQDQPGLMDTQSQVRGAYEYRYRPQQGNNKDWDNSYERP